MQIAIQKSRLQQLMAQRNGYLVLAVGLVLLCLLLSSLLFCLVNREKTIIVPPVIHQAFWLDSKKVSPGYLSEMTTFFAQLRLSVTPSSAAYQRETLLRYTDPQYYGALKNELIDEEEHLTQTHTSFTFYPVSVVVDAPHLTVKLSGDLTAMVGNVPLPTQRLTYRLAYRYSQGRLWLQSFQEDSNPSDKAQKEEKAHV